MFLTFVAFLAGVLTILSPCVFTLLPIILGSSMTERSFRQGSIILASLLGSIFLFSLLLKWSTLLLDVPDSFWKWLSGWILLIFWLSLLFPMYWEKITSFWHLKNQERLAKSSSQTGLLWNILVWASLWPVFSSCSPTYTLILAIIFPSEPLVWMWYLSIYLLWMGSILLAIIFFGQLIISRFQAFTNPNHPFRKVLGCIILIVGLCILFGYDKQFESFFLDSLGTWLTEFEGKLLE